MSNWPDGKNKVSELDEAQKWIIGAYSALLFALLASPFMYKLTNSLTEYLGFETSVDGCPHMSGLILHAVVFLLLVRLLMLLPNPDV
jgi:hypothetical protein